MGVIDFFRGGAHVESVPNRGEILARYQRLRAEARKLNTKLLARLRSDVWREGAKKLGLLRHGLIVFDCEQETSILADYCIFDVRRKGRNAVDQYLIDEPPDPDSDEMVCLRAMEGAVYSVYAVESVLPGLAVKVRDLRSGNLILLVDVGLSRTGRPGLMLASRTLFFDGFATTTGAALPIGVPPAQLRAAVYRKFAEALAPDSHGRFDSAPIIRGCLERDCSSRVRYEETEKTTIPPGNHAAESPAAATPSRNAPCPCGSGRKYKYCCINKTSASH